jgi:hypothetical protein
MTAFLTGWSGPVRAVPVIGFGDGPRDPAPPSRADVISCSVRRAQDGCIALTASVADMMVQKTVSSDGRAAVTIKRDDDLVSIVSARTTIAVSRGHDSVLVNVVGGHDEQLWRVRHLLLGSTGIRGLRTLATVLDESGSQSPEKLALRFTGALVAQLDGEEGAARRLSRDLLASYGGPQRRDVNPGLRDLATLVAPGEPKPTLPRVSAHGPSGEPARRLSSARVPNSRRGLAPAPTAPSDAVGEESRARATSVDCRRRYQAGVLKVANTFETSLSSFSFVNPMRLVCSFVFLMQVEGLWFTYVSESAGLLL